MVKCVLIDNTSHEVIKFNSRAALKRYVKAHNLEVKRSYFGGEETYYTEACDYIPASYGGKD